MATSKKESAGKKRAASRKKLDDAKQDFAKADAEMDKAITEDAENVEPFALTVKRVQKMRQEQRAELHAKKLKAAEFLNGL